jgi:hypothetical protein
MNWNGKPSLLTGLNALNISWTYQQLFIKFNHPQLLSDLESLEIIPIIFKLINKYY